MYWYDDVSIDVCMCVCVLCDVYYVICICVYVSLMIHRTTYIHDDSDDVCVHVCVRMMYMVCMVCMVGMGSSGVGTYQ